MTPKPPDRNLTPEAQYWGRWVEQQLSELQTQSTAQGQATAMALAGINASIGKLSDQISDINTLQGQMATQISDINTLQGQMATAISDITTLSNQQVGTASTFQTNGISIAADNAVYNTVVSASLTAPSWAGHAVVITSSYSVIDIYRTSAFSVGQTYSRARHVVNGSAMSHMPLAPTATGAIIPDYFTNNTGMATTVRSISIAGGATIPVSNEIGKDVVGTSSCTATSDLYLVAIFTR